MTEGVGLLEGNKISQTETSWWRSINARLLLSPKLIYFWTGCLTNMFYVFRADFFQTYLGLEKAQMGTVMAVFHLGSIIGATLWSRLADMFRMHRTLFVMLCLGMSLTFEGMIVKNLITPERWIYVAYAVMALFGLVYGGVSPLMDFQILTLLKDVFSVDQSLYGRQVLWGTIGYALTTEGLGYALTMKKMNQYLESYGVHILLITFPITSLITSLVVLTLGVPSSARKKSDDSESTENITTETPSLSNTFLDQVRIIATPRFLLFLSVILAIGMGRQIMTFYLPAYLSDTLNLEREQISRVYMCSALFSIIFLFSGPVILRKLGVRPMLLVGLGAMTIRMVSYRFVTQYYQVILVELLNGTSFSFTHMGGVREAAQCAPPGWEATFQAIYTAAYVQVPAVFGTFIGGYIYEKYSGGTLIWGTACISMVAFTIFFIVVMMGLFRKDRPCCTKEGWDFGVGSRVGC